MLHNGQAVFHFEKYFYVVSKTYFNWNILGCQHDYSGNLYVMYIYLYRQIEYMYIIRCSFFVSIVEYYCQQYVTNKRIYLRPQDKTLVPTNLWVRSQQIIYFFRRAYIAKDQKYSCPSKPGITACVNKLNSNYGLKSVNF